MRSIWSRLAAERGLRRACTDGNVASGRRGAAARDEEHRKLHEIIIILLHFITSSASTAHDFITCSVGDAFPPKTTMLLHVIVQVGRRSPSRALDLPQKRRPLART